MVSTDSVSKVRIPLNYYDAINDPIFGEKWREACNEEFKGKFETNKSWTYVTCPTGRKTVKSKWVFKVDYHDDGSVKRFKARIVAKGFTQIEGIDWKEKYASTLPAESMRCFLFDALQNDCAIEEADVVKAFTHADLEELIYMDPPEGFARGDKVCLLRKGVEGLKQGANGFMKLNATVICGEGFTRSMSDTNLFTRTRDGVTLRVAVYVDNLLTSFPRTDPRGRKQCEEFYRNYGKQINLDLRGPPSCFMGIELKYKPAEGELCLSQTKYITEAFEKFCDKSTKVFTTPVQTTACDAFMNLKAAETEAERMEVSDKPYLALMGTLIWALLTRPDVAHHVCFLCQFMANPTTECYSAALTILSYLYSTRKLGLRYRRSKGPVRLSLYADSSYGRSAKPIYGFVIFANGTPIAWASRKMKIVPLSSCEAEIYGCMEVCRCAMWIRLLLGEVLTTTPELPMVCHTDNEAAKATIEKLGVTARTKHYDTWMQYCRELITQLKITMQWIPTTDMIADIFTKCLDKTTFLKFRDQLMTEV